MNIRDLKYLVAVAEQRHFGKAAEACCVSQPALSMQLKKLEETLGVQLIERTNKSVLMTAAGKTIAARAQIILTQIEEMQEVAKLNADPESGQLKIGIIPTLAPYLLPHIIPELKKTFPKLLLHLAEEQTALLIAKLREGKLDAIIISLPLTEKDFVSMPLFAEEFLLAVPATHRLAKNQAIKLNELKQEELLLLEEGHCLRDQALAICAEKKLHSQTFWGTSLETLRHMVAIGAGITLMPKLACKKNTDVCYIPFTKNFKPQREIGMVWRQAAAKEILLNKVAHKIEKILRPPILF